MKCNVYHLSREVGIIGPGLLGLMSAYEGRCHLIASNIGGVRTPELPKRRCLSMLRKGFLFHPGDSDFSLFCQMCPYIFNQTIFTLVSKSTNHKKGGGTRVKTRTLVPPMFIGQSVTFLKILALTLDLKKKKRCQELEQMQLRIGNCREKNHLFIHIWFGSIG